MPKARIFNVMQFETNPVTGVSLNFSEQNIIRGVNHKSIERWAYIRHDKDDYTELDVERMQMTYNMQIQIGQIKPPHWHVVLQCPSAVDTAVIARWFGIPENMIEIPKGKGAFIDCVEYLRHTDIKQKLAGKYQYDAAEVKANFDWETEVDALVIRKTRYGKKLSDKDWYRNEIYSGNMTINELIRKDRAAYVADFATLDRLRAKYIRDNAPLPPTRINYYIDGEGGLGKGLLSRALARSLYPDIENDEDVFFNVGAKGSLFDGYDGQPVIIWNDRRAIDMITELNGRGNVFNVLDTHPTRQNQNIKYGSIQLCNTVNIINGIEDYEDFLNGLAGEYKDKNGMIHESEDKNQAYRRMPFIIRVHEDDFDIFLNRGFSENTHDFREYIEYNRVRASMKAIAERCGHNEQLARSLQSSAVKPIVDKHNELMANMNGQQGTDDEIREYFKDVGMTISIAEGRYNDANKLIADGLRSIGLTWNPLPFSELVPELDGQAVRDAVERPNDSPPVERWLRDADLISEET